MTAQLLSLSVDRTGPILDARAIAPLSHVEAGALARVELERFLQLLESLDFEDWERPTMCTRWSVRDILAHQAGAYCAGSSFAELCHQFSQKLPPGCEVIDVVNTFQIAERAGNTPAELIAELREVGHRAIAARQRIPWLLRNIPLPIPGLDWCRLGYLTDEIFLRDTWIHRVDISQATGRSLLLTREHDGLFTALIGRDLARRLTKKLDGAAVLFDLDGPAGGRFRMGRPMRPAATIAMDAIDFHLHLSARITAEQALVRSQISGDKALAAYVLQQSFVPY